MATFAHRILVGTLALVAGGVASAQVAVPHELVLSTFRNSGFTPVSGSLDGTQTWLKRSNSAFQGTPATIDGGGNVAFSATLTAGVGGVVGGPFDSGVGKNQLTFWYGSPGSLSLQARYGDPTLDNANCGGPGAVFTNRYSQNVWMSPNGYMMIGGYEIAGGTTTAADRNVIWTGQAGAFHNLARGNDVYLNVGNSQQKANVTSASGSMVKLNNFGQTPLLGQTVLGVGDTTATSGENDSFLGVATTGSDAIAGLNGRVTKVVRKGDDLVGGGSKWFGLYDPCLNHSGALFSVYNMTTGANGAAGPGGVTGNDDFVLMYSTPSGSAYTNTVVGREGGPTGVGAIEYATAPTTAGPLGGSQSPFVPTGQQFLNNGGRAIWAANLKNGVGGVTSANNAAIMTYKNGVTSIVARKGDVMFGIAPLALAIQSGSALNNVTLSNGNQVAWIGKFVVDGVNIFFTNDEFLAVSTIDASGAVAHKLIAREGDQIPGMAAGVHWSQPLAVRGTSVFGNIAINAAGMVMFNSRIDGPGITRDDAATTLGDDWAAWLYTPASCGNIRALARRGDRFDDNRELVNFYYSTQPNAEGSTNGLNDENWLSFNVDDNVNEGAIYRVHVCAADLTGSVEGVPDAAVDINDLLYFLSAFEQGSCAADLDNGSGTGFPDAAVDINDLLFFLIKFEAGC